MTRRACVFCGSRDGDAPVFREAAVRTGAAIARQGLELVYGGARHGLMGAVADAVLAGGQRIIGVIPTGLAREEFPHPRLSERHDVPSMAARKERMGELSDVVLALPGGFGTLDELFEELTGVQLALHQRPIGLLDVDGYYAPLVAWMEQALRRGFVPARLAGSFVVHQDPDSLVAALLARTPPH